MDDFWTTFGALWDPLGAQNPTQIGLFFRTGSEMLKKYDFGLILDRFFIDFELILDRFSIDFGSILDTF